MPGAESYLDLSMGINGLMDAFLLILTGRLLHRSIKARRILAGVLWGEIPVLWSFFGPTGWLFMLIKILTPVAMIWAAYGNENWRTWGKVFLGFWVVSAGLGGWVYAGWNWLSWQNSRPESVLRLSLGNLWILPLAACLWWAAQKAWLHWRQGSQDLQARIFEVEIDFAQDGQTLKIRALLDTGNQLRDPLNGAPVMLVEEAAAIPALPAAWLSFLRQSWPLGEDPWPRLWQQDPQLIRDIVFVPFQAIQQRGWLVAVRPKQILIHTGETSVCIHASVALVKQELSSEGAYQALLHPEMLARPDGKITGKRGDAAV
ncbi:MAG: sigma-E processing peptidase SpoIIGA [Peptococcaceae bacterium]|jgi:stage II sporulation protein GA (sporulation sigma-E factor processing peptidase)|nr:sigma-E processing peptidase SpoIIGA [Peptococcaceae bacterium]